MTRLQLTTLVMLTWAFQGSTIHAAQQAPVNADAQALVEFTERIDQYIAMRKKADDGTPPLKETNEPAEIQQSQQALAARIRAARAAARQGEIFTPAIAAQLRRLLRPELDKGTKDVIKEDNPGSFPFKVNDTYPEKEALSTVPPNVLAALPELPKDHSLEYRFVGKHMILRDTRANLIVDYIPNAIP